MGRSAKKKEISPDTITQGTREVQFTSKRLKKLSNPEEDVDSGVTPEKFVSSPVSSSSTIENRRVNHSNATSRSLRKERLTGNTVTTPVSSKKKPPRIQKGSTSKSLAAVDHNKQYVLDAGQKDFDGFKTCNDCGMVYTKGIEEDELHHKAFHDSVVGTTDPVTSDIKTPAKSIDGFPITPSRKSLSLKLKSLKWSLTYKGVKERVLEWVQLPSLNNGGRSRIIGFTSVELLKNEKLLNLVDKYFRKAGQEIGIESGIMEYNQLFMHLPERPPSVFLLMIISEQKSKGTPKIRGAPQNKTPALVSTTPTKVSAPSPGTPCNQSTNDDYVAGLISCESINTAERLISENPLSCSTNENIPAKIGVSRLWTSSAFRRQHVATQLLDALRRHFMTMTASTSQVIPKEHVAFSDPTESGLKFAQKYFNRKDVLVFSLFHSLTPAPIEGL